MFTHSVHIVLHAGCRLLPFTGSGNEFKAREEAEIKLSLSSFLTASALIFSRSCNFLPDPDSLMHLLNDNRLRIVSNFGDGDCGEIDIFARARNCEETRRKGSTENEKFGTPHASRLLAISCARVYFARPTIAISEIGDYTHSKMRNAFPSFVAAFV